jgi:pilus assembly protein CpaC
MNFPIRIFSFLCLLLLLSSCSWAEELILLQGQRKSFPRARSVWVENGSILRVDEGPQNEWLRALRPGQSELRLGEKSFQIQVISLEQSRTKERLDQVLKTTLHLYSEVSHGEIFIKGKLLRWKDWESIASSCLNAGCKFNMAAQMTEDVFNEAESHIHRSLSEHSLPLLRIEVGEVPTVHIAQKSVLSKELERTLAPYGIRVENSPGSIEVAPLVKIQITVAEVKKDFFLQYGVKWPASYEAQILPLMAGASDAQFVAAQFWEHTGAGRVLASPNILCRSGKDAEFVAGGEFPIKIINFRLQDVIWKKYGIVLKVSPLADYSGNMSISLETEVSSIDPSRTVEGVPGLFTNRVQSHFDLSRPRTIALSGLIKNEESKNSEGLPSLSRIPFFGALFSSRDFRENKTELVIFVRPEIIHPDAPDVDPLLPKPIQSMSRGVDGPF